MYRHAFARERGDVSGAELGNDASARRGAGEGTRLMTAEVTRPVGQR